MPNQRLQFAKRTKSPSFGERWKPFYLSHSLVGGIDLLSYAVNLNGFLAQLKKFGSKTAELQACYIT